MPGLRQNQSTAESYSRSVDLKNGLHTTQFKVSEISMKSEVFCSFPDQVCVYLLESTDQLPEIHISLRNDLVAPALQNVNCTPGDQYGLGYTRLKGLTQLGPPLGMRYDAVARILASASVATSCSESQDLVLLPRNGTKSIGIVVGAGTDFDQTKGTADHGYSFRGEDPGLMVDLITRKAAARMPESLRKDHIEDFEQLTGQFDLSLPDTKNSSHLETAKLIERYNSDDVNGDPYLESLLFDYATYMFISSSRNGSLPPNLQGIWSEGLSAAWSADYHANINLQMNHWTPDQTGLTDLQSPLWDYMANTWMPRGKETAKLLYGAPGWVVHNEMNIFGHTGMKSGASWANYPVAAAWMMQHVFDHWEYSQDKAWLQGQGYPMLKGVAEFWLSQLQLDKSSGDQTLVAIPCNSPEHGPTTFSCSHYQQLIHQVFEATLTLQSVAGETDNIFVQNVSQTLSQLDKGFHVGQWGQIKEWKLSDSYGYDFVNDTHRHLSELVGWHPGYSLSSFLGGYANRTVQDAVKQKLYSRGTGNAEDANAGWAKVWRSACWARLNDTERAHFELRYAIDQNFAPNGFSMYSGTKTPFQIDANFGLGGAVLSMLVVDLPLAIGNNTTRSVVLGPAIPKAWSKGAVRGLRLRGGGQVDFSWDDQGLVQLAKVTGRTLPLRLVDREGAVLFET